jgi:thiol:disulfide interchange protein
MPAPGPDPGARRPQRRDPVALLAIAALLLLARVALGVIEARQDPGPAPADEAGGATAAPTDPMRWRTFGDGLTEARESGRPVLYDFTAAWCPPCRMLEREVFTDPAAAAALEQRFVPVRVLDRMREDGRNVAWVDSLQRAYHVEAFPTLVVTGPGGTGQTHRTEGFMGRDATLFALGAGASVRFQLGGAAPDSAPGR